MLFSKFFKNWNQDAKAVTFQAEACPNCWGRFEWDNELKPITVDLEKDRSVLGRARKTFIRKFVDRYLPKQF